MTMASRSSWLPLSSPQLTQRESPLKHPPLQSHASPLIRRRSAQTLAVGFLCFIIQFYHKDYRHPPELPVGKMKLCHTWITRLLKEPQQCFKPVLEKMIAWMERKLQSARMWLLRDHADSMPPAFSHVSESSSTFTSSELSFRFMEDRPDCPFSPFTIKHKDLLSPLPLWSPISRSSPKSMQQKDVFHGNDEENDLDCKTCDKSPVSILHGTQLNSEEFLISSSPILMNPQRQQASSIESVELAHDSASFRMKENQYLIQSVLRYWFGQGRPEQSQRKLWMINASQSRQRALVDKDITLQFGELLLDLAWNRCNRWSDWTGCSWIEDSDSDNETKQNSNDSHQLHAHCPDGCNYGPHGKLAAIIVLDQFSRHILRHLKTSSVPASSATVADRSSSNSITHELLLQPESMLDASVYLELLSQSSLDIAAYLVAQTLLEQHAEEIQAGMLPTPMYIFAVMPLRHASTISTVQRVQVEIGILDGIVQDSEAMLRRFRTATNRRLALLQDEERRISSTGGSTDSRAESAMSSSSNAIDNMTTNCYTVDDLLEGVAFQADLTPSKEHPVHQTIRSFLASRGILPSSTSSSDAHQIKRPLIVSLSGGVDSMVIASVLAYLAQSCHYSLFLIAVHVDYGNRPESAAEADFVRRFCLNHLGGTFHFISRRVDEVTRGVTARDEYERISRSVRYDLYRHAVQHACEVLQHNHDDGVLVDLTEEEVGVMLGHHKGDLRENVLSNALRGCGPLDLSGMTSVSRNNGVTVYRPLLSLEKTAVFNYAHKYGVPYFKDTTPHWSTRGKVRNKLLPLLGEIYGEGSLMNLSNLAIESDACRTLVHSIAFKPFYDQVQSKPLGITFPTTPWKNYDLFFWKFVLRDTLHSVGLGMFSEKSVVTFRERIRASPLREGWIQCRRDYGVYLQRDGQAFVLYPKSFPLDKNIPKSTQGGDVLQQIVRVGSKSPVCVGPWRISARIHHCEKVEAIEQLVARKAIPSMINFMDGMINYYLWTRQYNVDGKLESRPLVFDKLTKLTRPTAWKNTDAKLQDTLPIVSNDTLALLALKDPVTAGVTYLNEQGQTVENPIVLVQITMQVVASEASPLHSTVKSR